MSENLSALELTRALVRFDTINPPGNERPCAEHMGRILEDAGFAVTYHEFAETRTSLVARIGGGTDAKPLCFTGHIDTVPLGAVPWSADPFAADIADGKLYGRGTSDMKSGVAAFVVAAIRLARELETGPGVVLVIRRAKQLGYTRHPWLVGLMERRSVKVAAVALANKIARIAWAMMARNESYRTPLSVSA